MDIMYWTFPHVRGAWSIVAGQPNILESGVGVDRLYYSVNDWVNGSPVVYGNCKDNAAERFAGTRLICTETSHTADEPTIDAHYAKLAIGPFEYSMKNGLDAMQHTIIKYVTRFRDKGGIRDLEAALKTIDLLIAYEKESPCN